MKLNDKISDKLIEWIANVFLICFYPFVLIFNLIDDLFVEDGIKK